MKNLEKISFNALINFLEKEKVFYNSLFFINEIEQSNYNNVIKNIKLSNKKLLITLNLPSLFDLFAHDPILFDEFIKNKINAYKKYYLPNTYIINKYDLAVNSKFFIKKILCKLLAGYSIDITFVKKFQVTKNVNSSPKFILGGSYTLNNKIITTVTIVKVIINTIYANEILEIPNKKYIRNYLRQFINDYPLKFEFYRGIRINTNVVLPLILNSKTVVTPSKIALFTLTLKD